MFLKFLLCKGYFILEVSISISLEKFLFTDVFGLFIIVKVGKVLVILFRLLMLLFTRFLLK